MKYISYDYYITRYCGSMIPEEEFAYVASAASTVVDLLVSAPISVITDKIRLAVAYEAETLFAQGGIDAVSGLAAVTSGIDEKLGDYSIGTPYVSNQKRCFSIGGVPVSGMTVAILKNEGLMSRCFYTEDTV